MEEGIHADLFQDRKILSIHESNLENGLELQRKNWKVKVGICAMSKKVK